LWLGHVWFSKKWTHKHDCALNIMFTWQGFVYRTALEKLLVSGLD
jgi:hypothetical protein